MMLSLVILLWDKMAIDREQSGFFWLFASSVVLGLICDVALITLLIKLIVKI